MNAWVADMSIALIVGVMLLSETGRCWRRKMMARGEEVEFLG